MLPKNSNLTQALEKLQPHDHLCLIFESLEEWRYAVIPFLTVGLKRGEKCVYIMESHTAEGVRGYLRKEGVDMASAEASGKFVILHETEAYTREGSFDPDRMITFLIAETKKAIDEGYSALRVTGEMGWTLCGHSGSGKLIEYEAKLNRDFFPKYSCVALCQYDRWKFDCEIIKGAVKTHPLLVRGNRIYHNLYYIPPEEYLIPDFVEHEVQHWLDNLEREHESKEWMRFLVDLLERSSQPFAVSYPDGRLMSFNPAYCKLTGYNEEELHTITLNTDLMPLEWREAHAKVTEELHRTRKPYSFEKEYIHKDGSRVWVEVFAHPIFDSEGNLQYYYSFITEITERKRAEEELRGSREQLRNLSAHLQSVREEESKLIARKIHDELGQLLTALKIDLSWLSNRLTEDQESLLEKTESMSKLIDEAVKSVQKISEELRPVLLDDLGLTAAVEWQAKEFQNRTGIKCEATLDPEDIILDQDRSTAIFRIFQEMLTNIARHANATKIKVSLKEKTGKLVLKVRDNGKGITEKQISDPKSFGLMGMRERAHHWGGEVNINGIRDKGTTVTVSIPLHKKRET